MSRHIIAYPWNDTTSSAKLMRMSITEKNRKQAHKQALRLHRLGELVGAKQAYCAILQHDPKDVDAHHLLGILHAQQCDYQAAIPSFKTALHLSPNAAMHYNLGNSYRALGVLEKALQHYAKALHLDPTYALAHCALGDLLFKQEQYDKATRYYKQAISHQRGCAEAYYGLGRLAITQKDWASAIGYLERTLVLRENDGAAHTQLAHVYFKKEKYDKAAEHYKKRLTLEPKHTSTLLGLGACLVKQGHFEAGIKRLKQCIQYQGHYTEVYENLLAAYRALGDDRSALKYALWLYQTAPNLENRFQLGLVYMMIDQHSEALDHFRAILRETPNHLNAHMNMGTIYLKQRVYAKAILHYQKAYQLDPSNQQLPYVLHALKQTPNKALPTRAPVAYIKPLFDQYAPYFEQHLMEYLHYTVPKRIGTMVSEQIMPTFLEKKLRILDLGCGTGLCGESLVAYAECLTGVDVSEKMLARAKQKKIYHQLVIDDILCFLAQKGDWHLLIAGDTLPYFGDLNLIFKKSRKVIQEKGFFVFTIEKTSEKMYQLQQTARYAHHPTYIEQLADRYQWSTVACEDIVCREQHQKPIQGYLYALQATQLHRPPRRAKPHSKEVHP